MPVGCPRAGPRADRKLIGSWMADKDLSAREEPTSGVHVSSVRGACRQPNLSAT